MGEGGNTGTTPQRHTLKSGLHLRYTPKDYLIHSMLRKKKKGSHTVSKCGKLSDSFTVLKAFMPINMANFIFCINLVFLTH